MADSAAVSVTFKHATVKSINSRKGKVTIAIEAAPLGEGDATISDFAEQLTGGTFLGEVRIRGKQQQSALDFGKLPAPDKDGGKD